MTTSRISRAAVNSLRSRFHGQIVQPGDDGYDQARAVYNAMHDRWPALVVRAATADDVVAAVAFGRNQGLLTAVRCGNHSIRGFGSCDDGLVIDLSPMRRVEVDPVRRLARVGAGCTWADLNQAAHAYGLATTGGLISTTGVAGLTLGGGIGYLSRSCGLACDNLAKAEVVTAGDGRLDCDASRNADLFWALRGGGGNFGVVTALELRLHPVRQVLGGPIFYPLEASVLHAYREFLPRAPEPLGLVLGLTLAPPARFLPAQWHGRPVAVAITCWAGDPADGEDVLRPLDTWAPVVGRAVQWMPYPALNTLFDDLLPAGLRHYWKSYFAEDLPAAAIEAHVEHAAGVPTAESGTFFYPIDGACHRVTADQTAFPRRSARFAVGIHGSWRDRAGDPRAIQWVRDGYQAVRPRADDGEYVNFASDDAASVADSYGNNFRRLLEVKRRYDPTNLFCLNQNIEPAR